MIDIQNRMMTLQQERAGLLQQLAQLKVETKRVAHLISAYDGALGELGLLMQLSATHEEPVAADSQPIEAS